MKPIRVQIRSSLSAILIFTAIIFNLACPQLVSINRAETASNTLAVYANQTTESVRLLYRSGAISLEQKNKIADRLIAVASGGVKFSKFIKEIKALHPSGRVPKETIARAVILFEREILLNMEDVLISLKILDSDTEIRKLLETMRASVILIARAFQLGTTAATRLSKAAGEI